MKNYLRPLYLEKSVIDEFSQIETSFKYESIVLQETKTETLILVPSEQCNLHCSYCYEVEKNPDRMDSSVAKEAIKKAFDNLQNDMRLKIELRGGEPFLEFYFIKEICDWGIENYKEKDFSFYAVTNGTCFSGEIKSWLMEHKSIFIAPLSIDGDKKTQDINRSNSFNLIDFGFLFKTWKNPYTYTTIIPENAKTIFDDLLFL